MTDLTEQWGKGELPSGEYYIIDDLGLNTTDKYFKGTGFGIEKPQKILAKVPTYEEYRNLQHCWVEELEENGQLKEQQETLEDAYNELVCINANLEDNCKTLAQTLLKVSPEHKAWLEKNYKEYL